MEWLLEEDTELKVGFFPKDGRYFSFCLYADEVISRVGKLSNVLEEARRNGI